MAAPVLNLSAYSSADLDTLLTAAKAALLQKITGTVQQGSSSAQSYSLQLMTVDELTRLINAITDQLGLDNVNTRVSPNFNPAARCPDRSTFGA